MYKGKMIIIPRDVHKKMCMAAQFFVHGNLGLSFSWEKLTTWPVAQDMAF